MPEQILDDDEVQTIRDHLANSPRERAIFELVLNEGLAIAEVLDLDVGGINETSEGEIVRVRTDSRSLSPSIPTRRAIANLLEAKRSADESMDDNAPLFCNDLHHRFPKRAGRATLRDAFRACGMPGLLDPLLEANETPSQHRSWQQITLYVVSALSFIVAITGYIDAASRNVAFGESTFNLGLFAEIGATMFLAVAVISLGMAAILDQLERDNE